MATWKILLKLPRKNYKLDMFSIKEILIKFKATEQKQVLSLLTHLLNKDLSYILAHPEKKLSQPQFKQITSAIKQLENGYPLAYIIKEQYFYSRKFNVTKNTLIPRPESEDIIDLILNKSANKQDKQIFIDIGTGSGALIISLSKEIEQRNKTEYDASLFLAGDISPAALSVARQNAKSLQVSKQINFKSGDLAAPFLKTIKAKADSSYYIMANLPYLTPKERRFEPSIRFEPDLALLGGRDGLSLYRQLLKQLRPAFSSIKYYLIMEINPKQAETLSKISINMFPKARIKKKSDLSAQTRFIILSNF